MFRIFRRLVGRVAGTVVLVLATQLTYAGQMDLAVMSGGMTPATAHNVAGTGAATDVDRASQACCDRGTMNALTCVASTHAVDAAVSGAPPIADLLPPVTSRLFVAVADVSPPRRDLPAASAGSFPPQYILFRRFLS